VRARPAPTVPIRGLNTPDPTTGGEPEGEDLLEDAKRKLDDPDSADEDGLA